MILKPRIPFAVFLIPGMSAPLTLHIFNPETDYALASGRTQYTPPKNVRMLRKMLHALPVIFAKPGDTILALDDDVDHEGMYSQLCRLRGVEIITLGQLKGLHPQSISPWGWNAALRNTLLRNGLEKKLMPAEEEMELIRALSHRRNTIPFLQTFTEYDIGEMPCELKSMEEFDEWLGRHPDGYLKSPWSSSGRGVLRIAGQSPEAVRRWAGGSIRTQGSVMVERPWDRTLDFASEWEMTAEGRAIFKGLSVFETNESGRYSHNISDSTAALLARIRHIAPTVDDNLFQAQSRALAKMLRGYVGPVGIDMLADKDGRVNPCVEINLRHTMGMTAAALYKLTGRPRNFNPLTPDFII